MFLHFYLFNSILAINKINLNRNYFYWIWIIWFCSDSGTTTLGKVTFQRITIEWHSHKQRKNNDDFRIHLQIMYWRMNEPLLLLLNKDIIFYLICLIYSCCYCFYDYFCLYEDLITLYHYTLTDTCCKPNFILKV